MSVESYLESIRKNTIKNSEKTSNLNNTMKDLLNYESLKKAVSAGVESGNKEQFKRLAELSKKILTNSDATTAELKETNQLLKLFYAQIPKNSSGSTAVSADSWVKALKEVLDEFGNSLPEKFQKRLKYDIVSSAAEAGANPKLVMQQLNMTQVNQTMVVQNIFDYMKDKDKKLERDAEARKPIENNEKKEQSNFWQTRLGKVIDYLGGILKSLTGVAKWAGIIAVGMAVWSQLKDSLRNALQGLASLHLVFKGGMALDKIFPLKNIAKGFGESFKNSAFVNSLRSALKGAARDAKGVEVASGFKQLTLFDTRPYERAGTGSFWDRIKNPIKSLGTKIGTISKNIGNFFEGIGSKLAASKLGAGFSKLWGFIKTISGPLGKLINFLSVNVPGLLAKAGKFLGPILRVGGKALMPILGKILWPIQIVASVFDFIKGFTETKGTMSQKIAGGLWNVVKQFFNSIWSLIKWIPKALWTVIKGLPGAIVSVIVKLQNLIFKALKSVWDYIHKKGFPGIIKDLKTGVKSAAVYLARGFGEMIAGILDAMMDSEWIKLIPAAHDFLKSLREKLPNPKVYEASSSSGSSFKGLDFKFDLGVDSGGGGIYEPVTNTVYTGRDALSAAMPLESHIKGRTPANASGINKGYGVKLSSQTADFIKRAGITERITSGMEGVHKGNKYNPRSHASGNKFDMDISTSSVSKFANTVEKLLRTPGIREIRTERVPNWVVEGGRKLLERKGYKTRGILFNDGYPNYATGPHLDVLIDPRYSGVKGSTRNLASTQSAIDEAGDFGVQTQKVSNPLVASMQAQIAKAYNEAVKSFGVKSPNQLVANQSKANTSAITAQLANKASGNAVTFSKKNDISDTNLALLRLVDIV